MHIYIILTGLAVTLDMTSTHGFSNLTSFNASFITWAAFVINTQWNGALKKNEENKVN